MLLSWKQSIRTIVFGAVHVDILSECFEMAPLCPLSKSLSPLHVDVRKLKLFEFSALTLAASFWSSAKAAKRSFEASLSRGLKLSDTLLNCCTERSTEIRTNRKVFLHHRRNKMNSFKKRRKWILLSRSALSIFWALPTLQLLPRPRYFRRALSCASSASNGVWHDDSKHSK